MDESKPLGLGVPIGVNDRHGNPIHTGDTLSFDRQEWFRGKPGPYADLEFVIRIERGEIVGNGSPGDWSDWCEVIKTWDGRNLAQQRGLDAMIAESEKLGLYEAEAEGIPKRLAGLPNDTLFMHAADKYKLADGRTVYTGDNPVTFDNTPEDKEVLKSRPWLIEHPDLLGQLWRVKAIECHCIFRIRAGSPIGLIVEPWEKS